MRIYVGLGRGSLVHMYAAPRRRCENGAQELYNPLRYQSALYNRRVSSRRDATGPQTSALISLESLAGQFSEVSVRPFGRAINDVNVGEGSPFLTRFAAPHGIRFHFLASKVDLQR